MKKKKVIRRKIKWKVLLKFLFLLFLIGLIFWYLFNLKTKHIIITGNNYITDNEIITTIGFKDYPYLFRVSNKEIKEKLSLIPMLNKVEVNKSIFGTLSITVEETSPLFFNRNNNTLVLANGKEINSLVLNGVPTLINYVPDTLYSRLITNLSKIDQNVINLISEIEYQPWKNNDVMIDETRFFLRMTDGNSVYINLINIGKLNNYIEIFASLEGKQGILYLDSSSDKISFSLYN